MRLTFSFFLISIFLVSSELLAQENFEFSASNGHHFGHPQQFVTNDFETLIGSQFTKKLPNKFQLEFNYQTRFNQNATRFKAALGEVGLKYKFNNVVAVQSGVRYGLVSVLDFHGWNTTPGPQARVMLATYLNWKPKGQPFSMQSRFRVEQYWGSLQTTQTLRFLRLRTKGKVSLFKFVDAYGSFEPFIALGPIAQVSLVRFEGGLNWNFKKGTQLNSFYRLEVNNNYFRNKIHTVGIVWEMKY